MLNGTHTHTYVCTYVHTWHFHVHNNNYVFTVRTPSLPTDYIVLDNAVSRFHYPSVLDLKLGMQSHSDLMTAEKKQHHIMRCSSTTTASLGFRFSGMQVNAGGIV